MKALLFTFVCLSVLAVACGGEEFGPESNSAGSSSGSLAVGPDVAPDASTDSATTSSALTAPDRLIVTTDIDIEVGALQEAYVDISGRARDLGGFVADAQRSAAEEQESAFLRLRIPAPRHEELLTALRNLPDANVTREESTAREVTAEYTDLRSRLTNLQATEAQYRTLLTRAGDIEDVLKVTAKLDQVRGDIDQTEGRIKLLEDQSDFATVAVRLRLPPPVEARSGLASPLDVLVDAATTSLTVAHAALNVAVVLFVAGAWLIPATLIALLVRRRFRRQFAAVKTWFG
jgi:Domain of unknown function (DUF4349)